MFFANQGEKQSCFRVGKDYYDKKQYREASLYLGTAASQNHAKELYYVGLMYEKGYFYEAEINKAIEYYKKADLYFDDQAPCQLGYLYHTGTKVPQNYETAVSYYKIEVERNNKVAQYNLGLCYNFGDGTLINYEKAKEKLKKYENPSNSLDYFVKDLYF